MIQKRYKVICPVHGVEVVTEWVDETKASKRIPGSYGLAATCPHCDWERGRVRGHKRPRPVVVELDLVNAESK